LAARGSGVASDTSRATSPTVGTDFSVLFRVFRGSKRIFALGRGRKGRRVTSLVALVARGLACLSNQAAFAGIF